jgi:hypothetical protein
MKKARFSEEQIIGMLKQHETGQHETGMKTADLCWRAQHHRRNVLRLESYHGGLEVN